MAAKSPSKLEAQFEFLWRVAQGPPLKSEFKFHPTRKWRADFAHLDSHTLIEIEGGIFTNGRHTRGAGYAADLEKYLEATLAGWRVVRLDKSESKFEQRDLERDKQFQQLVEITSQNHRVIEQNSDILREVKEHLTR